MIKGDLKTQARADAFPSPLPRATGGSTAATATCDVDPPFCPVIVAPMPLWRNGRRGRLKICCSQGRGGSSPSRGTKQIQRFVDCHAGGADTASEGRVHALGVPALGPLTWENPSVRILRHRPLFEHDFSDATDAWLAPPAAALHPHAK